MATQVATRIAALAAAAMAGVSLLVATTIEVAANRSQLCLEYVRHGTGIAREGTASVGRTPPQDLLLVPKHTQTQMYV